MSILYNRPLATVCFIFLLSLAVCVLFGASFALFLGTVTLFSLVLSLVFVLRRHRLRRTLLLLFCLAAILLGSLLYLFEIYLYEAQAEKYGDLRVRVTGTVTELLHSEYTDAFFLEVDEIDGERVRGSLYVPYESDLAPSEGDTVCFEASLSPPSEWDGEKRLFRLADGVFAQAALVSELEITGETDSLRLRLLCRFSSWRNTLSARLIEAVEGESGALMSAMLLGKRELLSDSVSRDFRRTGLSHILAISGSHLVLLGGLALKLFRVLGLRHRASYAAMAVTVITYTMLTGLPASVIRATLMTVLLALSQILFRRADGLTSLGVAVALILLFTPYTVYDYGFWLSVIATFGILVYTEWRGRHKPKEKQPFWRNLLSGIPHSLCVTLCAIGVTLPLCAIFFGELSLISPLANLLLAPLLEGYLILSLPVLLFGHVPLLSPLAVWFGELILRLTTLFAEPRLAVISINFLSVQILLFVLLFTALALLLMRRVRRRSVLCALLPQAATITILLIFLQAVLFSQNALLYTISSKNEVLILYSERRALLCDYTDGGYETVALTTSEAAQLRLTEYEGYLLTHYHENHTSSVEEILESYKVRTLYLPTPRNEEEKAIYHTLREAAEKEGVSFVRYDENTRILLGNLTFIPHAGLTVGGHVDGAATVLSDEARLTYLGGAFRREENCAAAEEAVAKSTHLLFGRHGSLPNDPFPFEKLSSKLSLLLIPETARLPSALREELDEHGIPYRTQEVREYIPLD
ncbi:MAG: ComEC/Rec2 family competence protein [Clostridia bacterium]|nr:ComEC/Rec2 family competence protein [Clostridia bacterium]